MPITNKDIAGAIIDFLKTSVVKKEVPEDYSESIDVAIDCLADAFEVDKDAEVIQSKFGGKSLAELLETASSASSAAPVNKDETFEENHAQADALKTEGNRAMAAKNFDEAIEKYTAAINLNPKNAVYFSNRAAAYSSSSQHAKAVEDAKQAIAIDPTFLKAYSRLGLAQYALGDAKAAMEAYKKGLEQEGDSPSAAMTKGFETAKRRVEEALESSIPSSEVDTPTRDAPSGAGATGAGSGGAGAGGLPDLGNLFGGGGMPSFAEMMNNPQIMQAAQQMMQNPAALQGLMNNPAIRNMAQNFGLGGEGGSGPDLSDLMNNPMLQNLANQFGGAGGANGNNNQNSQNQ